MLKNVLSDWEGGRHTRDDILLYIKFWFWFLYQGDLYFHFHQNKLIYAKEAFKERHLCRGKSANEITFFSTNLHPETGGIQ